MFIWAPLAQVYTSLVANPGKQFLVMFSTTGLDDNAMRLLLEIPKTTTTLLEEAAEGITGEYTLTVDLNKP